MTALIDLTGELDDVTQQQLRDALYAHKVLFFRDQPIDHAQQIRFTRYFGPVTDAHPLGYTDKSPDGYPEILEVDSRTYANRGGGRKYSYANFWHSDVTALINRPRSPRCAPNSYLPSGETRVGQIWAQPTIDCPHRCNASWRGYLRRIGSADGKSVGRVRRRRRS